MARLDADKAREVRVAVEKWRDYFKVNIDQYHQMHGFVLGKQWNSDEEDALKTFRKVPLQFNKLATLVNTLLGEQQQNTPQLDVVPLSNCSEEVAQLRQTLTKDIMLSTDSKRVYQVAAHQAFVGGFGAFVLGTDYSHDRSFDQDIVYNHVKDATQCYWDIGAQSVSKIDGMFSGMISRMTRKKFKGIYGKEVEEQISRKGNTSGSIAQSEQEIALATSATQSDNSYLWSDDECVTIVDHYYRIYEKDTLYKLSNGDTLNQEEMDSLVSESKEHVRKLRQEQLLQRTFDISSEMYGGMAPAIADPSIPGARQSENQDIAYNFEQDPIADGFGYDVSEDIDDNDDSDDDFLEHDYQTLYVDGMPVRIEEKRKSKRSKIMHQRFGGDWILEETEFPAEDLPVIFVDQNSYYDSEGKQVCRPFVIDAVDAQRFLNYLGTQIAFTLKISRYDQFIGSKKNIQGKDTQTIWKDPNSVQGMLWYDESPSGSKPEQLRPPELSQSLGQQYQRAIDDMYTSTGLFPSRLGQQGNEISGAAIDARTRQGSYSTYVAFNSVNRAISDAGKIVNQMIPRVYDSQRVLNLMTPDKGRQNIVVNQKSDEYDSAPIKNDLTKGTFAVILQAGPSYEGQKEQALESLNLILKANPSLLNMIADLYAENLPLSNTIEIKNRLKTLVPAEILEAGKTGQMPQEAQRPSPQDQAAMAEIEFRKQEIEIEKQKLELEIKEQEEKTKQVMLEFEMKRLQLAAELEEQKLRYMAETDRTKSDNAISHANNITRLLTSRVAN